MAWLFPYILFLHVMGAILAFGPTYAFSIIGAMGGKEPQHANFGVRVTAQIGSKLVYPLAILQGASPNGIVLALPDDEQRLPATLRLLHTELGLDRRASH